MREADGVGVGNLVNLFYSLFLTFLPVSLFRIFQCSILDYLFTTFILSLTAMFFILIFIISIVVFPPDPKIQARKTEKPKKTVLEEAQQSKVPEFSGLVETQQ